MIWVFVTAIAIAIMVYLFTRAAKPDLSILPEQFVVFDLETTGLKPETDEIIEIGAIRVNRNSDEHTTFQALVRPSKPIPKKITTITGITQDLVDDEGELIEDVLPQFLEFIGDLRLVAFNAEFDMAFIDKALSQVEPGRSISNPVSCALKMSRRAWPGLKSYRLAALASRGGLTTDGAHRAINDCKNALIVYTAAASDLRSAS